MQNNDMDSCVSGTCSQFCQMGSADCAAPEQEFEYVSEGYRWFKVNTSLHMYMSVTTMLPGFGSGIGVTSKVLAYVQLLPCGKFRALRSRNGVNMVIPIPYGKAEEMISQVEENILAERSEKMLWE